MKIPPEKIDAWVRAHFDVKERKGGTVLCIDNPLVRDTGKHLGINIEDGWIHDWRSDNWVGYSPSGAPNKRSFLKFVQLYKNCSFSEALLDVLGSRADANTILTQYKRQNAKEIKGSGSLSLPNGTQRLVSSTESQAMAAVLRWLLGRGINNEMVKKHNIMHCGLEAVWPYYEYDDNIVYWQSRSILQKRYLFPDESVGVTKGQFLYGFNQIEPASYVIITEAIFGAMTLDEQCLAVGGAQLTPQQVAKIRLLNPKQGIILAPDNDTAGISSILFNSSLLGSTGYKIFYSLPPRLGYQKNNVEYWTKDWNELFTGMGMGAVEVRKIFENAVIELTMPARIRLRKEQDYAANFRR